MVFAAAVGLAAASAATAAARLPPPGGIESKPKPRKPAPAPPQQKVRRILFPVVGRTTYSDDFGEPRGQGPHQGIDILAKRRSLAVAAETGKVRFHTTSAAAGCMLYLYGASGTTYLYIHLNNDTSQRNDNGGRCIGGTAYAPGLKSGQRVQAGDIVGFVGDSGDADGIHPHLHFEVHPKDGAATNPYPLLRAARKLLYSAPAGKLVALSVSGTLLATAEGELRLKIASLRSSSGLNLDKVGRTLVLATLPGLGVEAAGGAALPSGRLATALNRPVVVFTEPAGWTLRERLGTARALRAARVIVPAG